MLFFNRKGNTSIPNTSLPKRKAAWPLILATAAAVLVFCGSLYYLQDQLKTETRTIPVPVAKTVIPRGAMVSKQDIEYLALPEIPQNCAVTADQVVGKVALTTIYQGEPFRRERLEVTEPDKQEVTINIDLARSGLAAPGDLVDIYLLREETSWAYRGELVALNAVVRSVRDAQGQEVVGGKLPAVVQVAVKPEEVARIVRGAGVKNAAYALVKKYREADAPAETWPEQTAGTATGFNLEELTRAFQESIQQPGNRR